MARFWGEVRGIGKHAASRTGSRRSGLDVSACGDRGIVTIRLWNDPATDQDHYRVWLEPVRWQAGNFANAGRSRLLAEGLLEADGLVEHPDESPEVD